MNAIKKKFEKKRISLQTILNLWKAKWGEIPSITITNSDNAWIFLIVSRKGRIRLSFVSTDYKKLLKHVYTLASDPSYYPQKRNNFSEFALQLKKLRKIHKITQQTLASAMGVSQSTVAEWESGMGKVSDELFDKMREVIETIGGRQKVADYDPIIKNVIPVPKRASVTIIDPSDLEINESLV
jgi:transcriptional regulator with XRE-family HTH domain